MKPFLVQFVFSQGKRKWKQLPGTEEEGVSKREDILSFFRKKDLENYYGFFKKSTRRNGGFYLIVWVTEDLPVEEARAIWRFGFDRRYIVSGNVLLMNSKTDEIQGNPPSSIKVKLFADDDFDN